MYKPPRAVYYNNVMSGSNKEKAMTKDQVEAFKMAKKTAAAINARIAQDQARARRAYGIKKHG